MFHLWKSIKTFKSHYIHFFFFSQKLAYFSNKEDTTFKKTQNEKLGHDSEVFFRVSYFQ